MIFRFAALKGFPLQLLPLGAPLGEHLGFAAFICCFETRLAAVIGLLVLLWNQIWEIFTGQQKSHLECFQAEGWVGMGSELLANLN